METARGRWFLDEYAKRNRNADTSMVLDAVARIEQTLAAQKQPPPPLVVDRLPAALISIRSAVEKAQEAGFAAFTGLRVEENLAPIRKGSRIIKEISWRWREIGADGRICDLLDSQVTAIDTACTQLAEADPRVALRAAFEIIRNEITAFQHDAGSEAEAAAPAPTPRMAEVIELAIKAETATAVAETAVAEIAPTELSPEEADAQDEALLEMVALEMAAPDPDEAEDFPATSSVADSEPMHITTPPMVEPITSIARLPEPESPPMRQATAMLRPAPVLQPAFQPSPSVAPEPVAEPSLGSTLIASGILRKPNLPANDPLAPIRRMSQAEKIAFFS
jgi:hypothetical protein